MTFLERWRNLSSFDCQRKDYDDYIENEAIKALKDKMYN